MAEKQLPIGEALGALINSKKAEKVAVPVDPPEPQADYTHDAMIQLIIDNPTWSHRQYAAYFGHFPSWFASVLASEVFQQQLDLRRDEVADPSLTATLQERFTALTLRSMDVLQLKLDDPKAQDATILKALELGVKALGLGNVKREEESGNKPAAASIDVLAERLTSLMQTKRREHSVANAEDVVALPVPFVPETEADLVLESFLKETSA